MPYGEEIVGLGSRSSTENYVVDDIRQGFTGYQNDGETGLDFAEARMFCRALGRFTTPDPLMASANSGVPKTWNRYAYVLNNPHKYVDRDGMDVNILDEKARELILLTLPEKIREKVRAAIEKGKGNLTKGSLDKISSDDENFEALKFLTNDKAITEAATSTMGDYGGAPEKFFMTTWERIREKDIQFAMKSEGITREEAEKSVGNAKEGGRTGYLGQTYGPNGEDKSPRSPSGNLRAVAADGSGEGITQEDAVSSMAHELYGHAYLYRKVHKDWAKESNITSGAEERALKNLRGEQKKHAPINLKPKQ